MVDIAISGLPAAGASDGTEEAEVEQSGSSVRMAVDQIAVRVEVREQQSIRARHSINQSIPDAVWTDLNLDTEDFDFGGQHDIVTNNERITPTVVGVWFFSGAVEFAANTMGQRGIRLAFGGGATITAVTFVDATAALVTNLDVQTLFQMAASNFMTLQVFQNSGGVLNAIAGPRTNFCASLQHRT